MIKNIVMALAVLLFVGCSQKVEKEIPKKHEKVEVKIVKEATVSDDFIPEHIRKSHIEVVEH